MIWHTKLLISFLFFAWSASVSASELSLEQAVQLGLKGNLDLIAAKYAIPLAEADELTAGLWNNPTLQVDTVFQPFGGNWNQTSAGGPRQYDAILSYPLDLSGKHSAAKKSAHAATEVAQATFLDAVRQKVLQIRLAYIDFLTFQNQLSLTREKEQNLANLVRMIENKIGSRTRLPLLQRRAQLARDQAALDTRQREISVRTARSTLALTLGLTPEQAGELTASSPLRDKQLAEPGNRDALVKQALEERPDLKALRLGANKADLDQGLAKAQAWNDFNVQFGISSQGPNSANPNDPNSVEQPRGISWQASLQIPLLLFNRGQGNVQKAILSREQAEKQIDALSLSIRQEVDSDWDQLVLNRKLITEYEGKQLDSARKILSSQQTLFGTGGSALLDYFDAVNAYQSTLSAYYDAVGEYRRSLARLEAALGKDIPGHERAHE